MNGHEPAPDLPRRGGPGSARARTHPRGATPSSPIARVEAVLRAGDEWRRTFDAVTDLIAVIDEHHRIVRVNRAMAERIGRKPAECIGLRCHDVVHGTDVPPAFCPHAATLLDHCEHSAEFWEHRLGSTLHVTTTPIYDAEGRPAGSVHVARDVTEQRRVEKQLQWLASFPGNNPSPVVETDLAGRLTYLNPAAERLLPGLADAGTAHPWLADLAGLAEAARIREARREVTVGERTYEQAVYYVEEGPLLRIYGRDITERKRAADALRESEEKYRRLFENMAEAFALYELLHDEEGRPADWHILEVNAAYAAHTGLRVDQVVGRRASELFPQAIPEYLPRFARVVATGEPESFETYAEAVRRHMSVVVFPAGPGRFACTFTDISARKRAEIALAHALERHELLASAGGQLLAAADPLAAVEGLCRRALGHLRCHVFFNFLADPRAGRLRLNAYAGIAPEQAATIAWLDYGSAVCGCVARDGERIVAERIAQSTDERTALVRSWGVTAYACHPIRGAGGKVLGTLSFGSRTRETFDDEDLSFMRSVSDLLAVALARKETADELARARDGLERRVGERTRQLQAVTTELVGAEQRERQRLAEYLHDHLQQFLAGAKLSLGILQMRTRSGRLAAELAKVEERIVAAIAASRSLTTELSPPVLAAGGLSAALEWLARRFREEHRLEVRVVGNREAEPADEGVRLLLFQSVRELLFNVVKHAGVREAQVRVTRAPGAKVRVVVRDGGRGFDPAEAFAPRAAGGFGLHSIRARMENLGGALGVRSAPGRGSVLALTVPVAALVQPAHPAAHPRGAPRGQGLRRRPRRTR